MLASLPSQHGESDFSPQEKTLSESDSIHPALDAALVELSPRYLQWRDLWRKIAIDPDAYWEKA
jgi:hypothetical protein